MIRSFKKNDLSSIMQIWLDTNIKTHDFIPKEYWIDNYEMVRSVLPQAEVYVYEDDTTNQIDGFIGLSNNYIEGLFVRDCVQSNGIGKQLLEYAKRAASHLNLRVYKKNTRAIQFYQREQFLIQSENTDDDTNENEYIMIWNR